MHWISFFILISIKYLSKLFYRFEVNYQPIPTKRDWNDIRIIIFLHHTSLFEFLYLSILPNYFLWKLSQRMVAPAANKTMDRPLVGLFFKLLNPGMIPITRKRDDSWANFIASIKEDAIILIAPEGRMKRKNGLDSFGEKMTVKSGVVDILQELNTGKIAFAYSGGLHHIQVPDTNRFKIFKTLKMNIELIDVMEYKNSFNNNILSTDWNVTVLNDLQHRLETKIPK